MIELELKADEVVRAAARLRQETADLEEVLAYAENLIAALTPWFGSQSDKHANHE